MKLENYYQSDKWNDADNEWNYHNKNDWQDWKDSDIEKFIHLFIIIAKYILYNHELKNNIFSLDDLPSYMKKTALIWDYCLNKTSISFKTFRLLKNNRNNILEKLLDY